MHHLRQIPCYLPLNLLEKGCKEVVEVIKQLSQRLSESIVSSGASNGHSAAAIGFGLELILTYLFGTSILVVISMLCHQPIAWLLFILGFAPLRTTAGGFHAKSHLSCFIISACLFILSLASSFLVSWIRGIPLTIALITLILVYYWSPVQAKNKKLNDDQISKNRRKSLIISIVNTVMAFVFCVVNVDSALINLYFMGIAMAAASLIIAKIKTR